MLRVGANFLAVVMLHSNRIFTAPSPVTSLDVPYFPTLSHKRHDFWEKKNYWKQNVFWFVLQLLSERWKIYTGLHVKYMSFLPDFNETWILSTDFRKKSKTKFRKNPSSGSRVATCGQKDAIFRKLLKIVQNRQVIPDIGYQVNSYPCCLFMHQSLSVFVLRIFNCEN